MNNETKTYHVIVELNQHADTARISRDVPQIIDLISELSRNEFEATFRSDNGRLFGFFMKSPRAAAVIRSRLEQCTGTLRDDSFLVLEVGEEFNGLGFTRAWTWLQHH